MLFTVILQILAPFGSVVKLNAKETRDSGCFTYSLSANTNTVLEGY